MALAIDPSTPAATSVTRTGTTGTTAAFSPPTASVIFLFFSLVGSNSTQSVSSVTDSLGSHLSWSLFTGSRDNILNTSLLTGCTEVWWAACPSAQTNMTVTATYAFANNNGGNNPAGLMQPVVFTGATATQNGSATIRNSTSNGTPSQTLTTSANNSWVFGVMQNWTNSTGPTPGSGQTNTINGGSSIVLNSTDGDGYWVQTQTTTTPVSGTVVTMNDTAPTAIAHHLSLVEILAIPTTQTSVAWFTA